MENNFAEDKYPSASGLRGQCGSLEVIQQVWESAEASPGFNAAGIPKSLPFLFIA
jgi:hypothetical protein